MVLDGGITTVVFTLCFVLICIYMGDQNYWVEWAAKME